MARLTIKIPGTEVDCEGTESFLEEKVPQLLDAVSKSHNERVKRNLRDVHEDLQQDLTTLECHFADISQLCEEEAGRVKELSDGLAKIAGRIEAPGAAKQIQEISQSFSLLYLRLQQAIQQENRQVTTVSNIMKTKHDTAKSTINNIR